MKFVGPTLGFHHSPPGVAYCTINSSYDDDTTEIASRVQVSKGECCYGIA